MRRAIACAVLAVVAGFGSWGASHAGADLGDCGQPQTTGASPKTSDALAALRAAVGTASACDPKPCACDVNGSGGINTSDALAILRLAVGQSVTLECDCPCTELSGPSGLASQRGVPRGASGAKQIAIEARFVEVDANELSEISFDWLLSATMQSPVPPGGTSGHDANLAVSSNASGGPSNLQYFLYKDHPADGVLPILNKNFQSPFDVVKTFFPLPTRDCVVFAPGATSTPQNHPGGDPVDNLDTNDGGYAQVASLGYLLYTAQQADNLVELLAAIPGTEIFFPPMVRMYPGQPVLHMIDDVEPDLDDFSSDFRMRIQNVTMNPFGNFTGPVVDVTPTISADSVHVEFRLGTKLATFFFSTAFLVDGTPVDAEIPLHRRSTTSAGFTVPTGQTLVIGGLLRDGAQEEENGLPILGDIPLIGSLFTHKHLDAENSRLLVFLTPTIIDVE